MITFTGNTVHDAAVAKAEMVRQIAVAAAGSSQAAVKTAELVFYRACLASATAQGIQSGQFITALDELGTGGV